jgi:hypothetical protein
MKTLHVQMMVIIEDDNWLGTGTVKLKRKWPLRCKIYIIIVYLIKIIQFQIPVFRNHNLFLSSVMTYHRVCDKSNTTGVTSRAVTAYYLGASEFTSGFSGIVVAR